MNGLAKKRLGQNFLKDTGVLDRIVRVIRPHPNDLILDIGAGHGELSARLAPIVGQLLAIEFDRDCIEPLKTALAPYPAATVIPADILRLDLEDLLRNRDGRLRCVGNLPYNIATAVIEKLLRSKVPIADMVFMVQLEVARRIVASPGSKVYGLLSVNCQHLAAVRLEFKVNPAAFVPRPKVFSGIVTIEPNHRLWSASFEKSFLDITRAAFSHRRKTLANSLSAQPELHPVVECILETAGIDGSRRAEELSVPEYELLTNTYNALTTKKPRTSRITKEEFHIS